MSVRLRDSNGLYKLTRRKGSGKWWDPRFIFKVNPTGFPKSGASWDSDWWREGKETHMPWSLSGVGSGANFANLPGFFFTDGVLYAGLSNSSVMHSSAMNY